MSLLAIDNLKCIYMKSIVGVSGVSLSLKEGQIVAVLGPNGAGKTTTLRCIMGKSLLKSLDGEVKKGEVHFRDRRLDSMATPQVVKMGISMVAEGRGIFGDMTVEENLKVGAHCVPRGQDVSARYKRVYSFFPQLEARKKRLAGYLSGGEQQMLAIGRALMSEPRLILFDEISLGLAPLVIRHIYQKVKKVNEEGITAVLVEQDIQRSLKAAHYVYIIQEGKIRLHGRPAELSFEDIRKAYFGI